MRITGNVIANSVVNQLNLLTARQARLQNQASTGQRISAPEDDPAAMGEALSLQKQTGTVEQYVKSIASLQSRVGTASDVLQQIKQISDRASEIATQADGTKNPQDLQTLGTELGQLIKQVVQLANSKDGDQYIFAGTASGQAPFQAATDANGNVTGVAYQGNVRVAETEVAEGSTIGVDSPGENTSGSGPRGVFSDGRYGADFFGHLISLQNHLNAGDINSIAATDKPGLLHDEDNLIYHAANKGVEQARLDTAAATAQNRKAALGQRLTDVAGADLATTLVQLGQTQNAYQVALQSSAKLLELQKTLLDYLP